MPLLFYGAGFVSGILAVLIISTRFTIHTKTRPWTQIDSLKYTTNFNAEWRRTVGAYEIAEFISDAFVSKSKTMGFEVQPGKYSVRVFVEAIFTKREEQK